MGAAHTNLARAFLLPCFADEVTAHPLLNLARKSPLPRERLTTIHRRGPALIPRGTRAAIVALRDKLYSSSSFSSDPPPARHSLLGRVKRCDSALYNGPRTEKARNQERPQSRPRAQAELSWAFAEYLPCLRRTGRCLRSFSSHWSDHIGSPARFWGN